MADDKIRKALESHLDIMHPRLPTVWQGRRPAEGFNDTKAHQKAFVLRGSNRRFGLRGKKTLQSGIFQVNLCYPAGIGASEVEARGVALQEHFKGQDGRDLMLEFEGVKVQIIGRPDIGDPISTSPYVVPVSIRYQSIN